MSWMEKLYETYERAYQMGNTVPNDRPLAPSHTTQQAHVEITLDEDGNFLRASVLEKEDTLIPATENSASRSSGGAPHPLCDKIQYVAKDYVSFGGEKPSYFEDFGKDNNKKDGYFTIINEWSKQSGNPKLKSVCKYVKKGTVVKDLVEAKILVIDDKGKLLTECPPEKDVPGIFKGLTKNKGKYDQGDVFVRWCVNIEGEMENRVWKDEDLIKSWIFYNAESNEKKGLCFITGEEASLATLHPYKIRHSGDKAKLISSNDQSGFTFRGRFTDSEQACSIGYTVTQKAHSALRWLVARQAFRNDDQVIVAWEISGKELPKMMENTEDAFMQEIASLAGLEMSAENVPYYGDMGQAYALKLRNKIAGYRQFLDERDDIVVMGLDSSTPGRMAITYYRELKGSEFLDRLEDWHLCYTWHQYYGKDKQFVGAPSPKDIAEVAFGKRIDAKLKKSTISRILPCIVDRLKFPDDLQTVTFNRTINRVALDNWEWEKLLGIACGLYRGMHKEMNYSMALERERSSRDYLYGRLLAIAERIEQIALSVAGENRDTNAAKLMHRFAERPFSTWKQIELALVPYKTRLQTGRTGFLVNMQRLMDEIHCMFETDDYTSDASLSGEFLLGYHCQRYELRSKATKDETLLEENEAEHNVIDQEDE